MSSAPRVLLVPPWLQPRKKGAAARPLVLEPLPCDERVLVEPQHGRPADPEWTARCRSVLAAARTGEGQAYLSALDSLPDEEALALWNEVDPKWFHGGDYDGRTLVELLARFGVAWIPGLLRYARGKLPSALSALCLVVSPRVAPLVALGFASGKKPAGPEEWLLAHAELACIGLVPAAVGPGKKEREAAAIALRFLAGSGQRARVLEVAGRYGEEARARIEAVLVDDLPPRVPARPAFVAIDALPPIRLASGEELPREVLAPLVTMLLMTPVRPAYSGLADVCDACSRASLRDFAWALFEQWEAASCPAGGEWALFAVGHLGDDVAVERLVQRLPRWQSVGAAQRAAKGVETIALVGTPLAFSHLDRIGRKASYPLLRDAARGAVLRVARRLGLHPDELEDRQTPDLGLDADGVMVLTGQGGLAVRATLDELLRPVLLDRDGKRLKSLPRALGPENAGRYAALVKGARLVADSQIARFERAMISERTWTAASFLESVVGHPVLRHLARRVIWSAGSTLFRVAEDGTLADVADAALALDAASTEPVRLAHPLHMSEPERTAFAAIFGDYEILQPFLQLGRPVFALEPGELVAGRLLRYEGAVIPWERVLALPRHGYRDASLDSTMFAFRLKLPFDVTIGVVVEPGVSRADPRSSPPQRVREVSTSGRPLAALSSVAASEVVYAASVLA